MSTSDKAPATVAPLGNDEQMHVAIVAAEWNASITSALVTSAVKTLNGAGVPENDIKVFNVPGTIELTFAASQLIESGLFDVIIVFGCVIRGGTPHFDYVCQSVTQGITQLNADCDIPVIFGVLTVDDEQDAVDRCGGPCGDKGVDAAIAAISMCRFRREVESL